jgi:hypothetical protein
MHPTGISPAQGTPSRTFSKERAKKTAQTIPTTGRKNAIQNIPARSVCSVSGGAQIRISTGISLKTTLEHSARGLSTNLRVYIHPTGNQPGAKNRYREHPARGASVAQTVAQMRILTGISPERQRIAI